MSERDEQAGSSGSVRDDGATRYIPVQEPEGASRGDDDWREQTTPGMTPIRGGAAADPSVGPGIGWNASPAAQAAQQPYGQDPGYGYGTAPTAPPYSSRPVSVRRPDALAALLLVLAGVAAGISLLLPWVHAGGQDGWDILRTALRTAADDRSAFFSQGWWEPVVIVLGGGLLFLLGLLLFVPARTHRFLGALALLVALGVTAAVLVPMAQDGWSTSVYDLGWWFAAGVAGLGLLGALKAVMTGPRRRAADGV